MARKRSRLCRGCRKVKTGSVTTLCAKCRPSDAIPAVHRDRDMVSFAGLTFTEKQALKLADAIIDAIENRNTQHD